MLSLITGIFISTNNPNIVAVLGLFFVCGISIKNQQEK